MSLLESPCLLVEKAKTNSTLALFTVTHLVVLIVYRKIKDCCTLRRRADKMKKNVGKKENGQIKGLISHMWLIL